MKHPHLTHSNNFKKTLYLGAGFFLVCFVIGLIALKLFSTDLPDIEQLREYQPRLSTAILDRNGEVLTELYTERRMMTPLEHFPPHLISAILTTEDRRFYRHWGVDILRIVGATIINISSMQIRQGASTITQQLARDLYLHKRQTYGRKIREAITAVQIERAYSKDEILEMYLTQIYFGHSAYGITAAALHYFGKQLEDITLEESALLAALPKAPFRYSPRINYDRALGRRNLVLKSMLEVGEITKEEYTVAVQTPINIVPANQAHMHGTAPYFTEWVRQQLSEEGRRFGFDHFADGLTVHTSIDARLQRIAEKAVNKHLETFQAEYHKRFIDRSQTDITRRFYGEDFIDDNGKSKIPFEQLLADSNRIDSVFWRRSVVQVAFIAMDVHTGDILAMIGGRDFNRWKYNRAIQAIRQPGSAFKPVAYAAAIDNGYPPTYQLLNQDVVLTMSDGKRWVPSNYDGSKGGLTTLREAMRVSSNLVAVRLVQDVVPPRMVVQYARHLGFTTPIAAVDAIALGSTGVYPIEAVSAFGVFAAGGIHSTPRSIVSINDRFGEPIVQYPVKRRVALSPETAYIMTNMLETAINRGTGGSARWKYQFHHAAAGKTGTTNDFTDAWFIGYTPNVVCGVWVGVDDPSESLGRSQSGSVAALPIWAMFMKEAADSLQWENVSFVKPAGVQEITICDETKMIASQYCPIKVQEVFRNNNKPLKLCSKHRIR